MLWHTHGWFVAVFLSLSLHLDGLALYCRRYCFPNEFATLMVSKSWGTIPNWSIVSETRLFMWEASDWMTVEPRFSIPGLQVSTLWSQTALLSRSSMRGSPPKLDVNEPAHEMIFHSPSGTDDTLRRPPVWPSLWSLPDVPRLSPDLWASHQNGGQEVKLQQTSRSTTSLSVHAGARARASCFVWALWSFIKIKL